jgi:hypothetical protein
MCALRFIESFDDTISLQPGEPIDPKDPIKLVDLVLETYGEQTICLFDLFHTAQLLVAHPHTGMAFDLFRYARHGDTAFFVPDHVGDAARVASLASRFVFLSLAMTVGQAF